MHDFTMVDIDNYMFVKLMGYLILRVNPNAKSGLQVIMMCHYGFIYGNKCTISLWDGAREGGLYLRMTEGIWKLHFQFNFAVN